MSLEDSFCRWGFYFVVGDLRIPNALTVDLQSTQVADPQLFSCGSGDPQGQRHSYCNGMGHPKPLTISFFFPENFILIAQTDVFFENPH